MSNYLVIKIRTLLKMKHQYSDSSQPFWTTIYLRCPTLSDVLVQTYDTLDTDSVKLLNIKD
jgi:hypothetical protein